MLRLSLAVSIGSLATTGVGVGVGIAQPASTLVRGTVVDDTGAPVAGATLLRGTATAETDAAGAFAIAGTGGVTVIADGFATVTLAVSSGMVIRIERATDEVIEVTGTAPEETRPSAYTMTAKDVATTPGAMNDALRAITILPAAARIPFSFGGIVLRGMSPRDSSVFVDGVEIPIAFHFGGITGVFPTQVLDDMRVVPSGFDVSLGRTQGGVIELTTRTPRRDAYRIGGEVSLLHSQVSVEGPAPRGGAFLAALRRSYFDVMLRPLIADEDPLPSYTDGQLRVVWGERSRRGRLAAYVIGSLDRIANSEDAATPDPGSGGHVAANLGFVRAGVDYQLVRGSSLFTLAPSLGTNILSLYTKDYDDGPVEPTILDLDRRWYLFGTRATWLRDDPGGFVRAGLDLAGGYLGRIDDVGGADLDDDFPLPRNTVLWSDAAAFVETRRHFCDDRFSIRPGVRVDRFGLGNQWALDPRLNAHATLTPSTTLRASIGRFHQPPSAAHFDEFADNLDAGSSYVDQATLGVELAPDARLHASVTGFFHDGERTLVDIADENIRPVGLDLDLIFRELLEEQLGLYAYQDNVGRQRSYGLEAAIRFDTDRYRAAGNLAWSRAKRVYEPALAEGWVPYGLDQPLRLNLLFATTAYRWNIGARLTAVSGNPIRVVPAGTPVDLSSPGELPRVLQRLPTFWQVDVRVDRSWKRSWGDIILFFDVQNVTNHRNVEYRESYPDFDVYRYEDTLGLPILPYVGVEFAPR